MTNCTFKNHSTEGFQCFQLFHIPLVILHHVVPSQSCYSKSQSTVGYLSTTSYSMAYIYCLAATTSPTRPSCSLAGCQSRCLTNLKWLGIKGSEACNHLIQFWPFRRHPRHTSSQHLHTKYHKTLWVSLWTRAISAVPCPTIQTTSWSQIWTRDERFRDHWS